MSSVYVSAPPTSGKVILLTSLGPLDVELWSKEAPRASRNFVQLCMEGYYNGTIFHRVIKDFMIQGGDPTGTGRGGESIYGEEFKDEIHSRLRFAHRGIVAMANTGPNTNASQFFITLGKAEWIEKKYTIFGKITGDSIYNLIKANSLDTDKDDRPLYPPKIISVDVVFNPFEDIVPRVQGIKKAAADRSDATEKSRTRNKNLLSFGDEVDEDEESVPAPAPASKPVMEEIPQPTAKSISEKLTKATDATAVPNTSGPQIRGLASRKIVQDSDDSESEEELTDREKRKLKEKEEREREMKRLKKEIKAIGKEKLSNEKAEEEKPRSFLQLQNERFQRGKHRLGDKTKREQQTLKLLQSFKSKLASDVEGEKTEAPKKKEDDDMEPTDHGEDERPDESEDTGEPNKARDSDAGWMNHRLIFEKESRVRDPVLESQEDDYVVLDPRERPGYKGPRMNSHQQGLRSYTTKTEPPPNLQYDAHDSCSLSFMDGDDFSEFYTTELKRAERFETFMEP